MTTTKPKTGHARIQRCRLDTLQPSPENQQLYRPVDPDDPDIRALAESIRKHGVREPLVITADRYIISGHRRHVAARLAGRVMVPCRVESIQRNGDPDRFVTLLREYNRQRVKSRDEAFREEVVSADPEEAYQSLIEHREQQSRVVADTIVLRGEKKRAAISDAKLPMLNAIIDVLNDNRKFWPLSDRRIHYLLLNYPPLRHASKPDSTYQNDDKSYNDLTDLLTRARVVGDIPWGAIEDPTRPVFTWNVHSDAHSFIRQELDGLLKGYWRDLMQSQPNQIEIVGEKNTIGSIIRPVAAEFCIPLTLGRGYCSLPPRHEMAKRYRKSGREKLILLILSDFDPDGEEIAHSFTRSMRDDFSIRQVEAIKVALTADQVEKFKLPPKMKAKKKATGRKRFVEKHGSDDVFELEALHPSDLQAVLRGAIDSVLDTEAFNHELDQEKQDAAFLAIRRQLAIKALEGLV